MATPADKIFMYPWRGCLPAASDGVSALSPENGAFLRNDDGTVEELPGPGIEAEKGKTTEPKTRLPYAETVHQYSLGDVGAWPMRFHHDLTDALVWLSDYLHDARRKQDSFLDRPLETACGDYLAYLRSEKDFATKSLIVEIAANVVVDINQIVAQPRKVLIRRHGEVSLDRLQEFDSYALLDYAKRPGRTAAMKAGPRQRLTAVVREESIDTLENRVVVDFLVRALREARSYLAASCPRCPRLGKCGSRSPSSEGERCPSERIRLVDGFSRLCAAWLRTDYAARISRLSEPCRQPNYALQQNVNYLRIWRFYVRLIRRENIENEVWRWKRRSWSDLVRLSMMAVWAQKLRPLAVLQPSRKALVVRANPVRGCWLGTDPYEEALVFERDNHHYTTVYLLNPHGLTALLRKHGDPDCGLEQKVVALNADFYWAALTDEGNGMVHVCPVWTFVGDKSWDGNGPRERREAVLAEIAQALGTCHGLRVAVSGGWVVRPAENVSVLTGKNGSRFIEFDPFSPDGRGPVSMDQFMTWVQEIMP